MSEVWKSDRKIQEEIRDYKRSRFEWYMHEEDEGRLSREMAISALREELENLHEFA